MQKKIEILDCSIRDGGYVNNWNFSKELVREVYRAIAKSGIDFIELGFRSTEKYFDPKKYGLWRFSSEQDLIDVKRNIDGAKIGVMGDFGRFDLDDLSDKKDSCVDLFRMAAHKDKIFKAIDLLEKIKAKGYITSLQAMGYSCYCDQEKRDLIDALRKTQLDYVYVADSYGSILPFQMKRLFEPFLEIGHLKVGFHSHNNLQMSFANTIEAIRIGADIVDTTIYGIGRGAGNLPTEILLSYLYVQGEEKYNVIPVLNCIERYFTDLMKETPWGYQLPYMISGIFNSHPSYSKELLRRQEYSMEDIWKGLECVKEINPIGFDGKILDSLIRQGFIGTAPSGNIKNCRSQRNTEKYDFVVSPPYMNRHLGRDFLVLANGPNLQKHKQDIDLFISKYNPIVLGANFLNDLFKPDYHAFNNQKRFVSYIDKVHINSRLLLGSKIPKEIIADYVSRDYEPLAFKDILDADFEIRDGIIMSNCRTISVLLIGVAICMGAKRVFVAGMDGYMDKKLVSRTLFYKEKFDATDYDLNMKRHHWNEHFLKQIDNYLQKNGGEGIHIITPTSHSSFYKSISNYIWTEHRIEVV